MSFVEKLNALPVVSGERLHLADASGAEVAIIENAPGTAGSFRVYAYLASIHGGITPAAAEEGLEIFSEHAEDARLNPGKHPNIDRLLKLLETGDTLATRIA